MKRVLMYASVASMIDLFNRDNIKMLQNLGYEVDVAANFEEGNVTSTDRIKQFKNYLADNNVKVINIPIPRSIIKISQLLKAFSMTRKLIKLNQYDLIYCQTPIGGAVCRIAAKGFKTKIIYAAHGFHFYDGAPKKNWLLFKNIEKICSYNTDVLITINSEDYKNALRYLNAKKTVLVPGVGLDLTQFYSVDDVEKRRLREEYGYNQRDFILFFAGELNSNKNQQMLIQVVRELKDDLPEIKLLLAGKGPNLEKYAQLVVDYNLQDKIELLGFRNDINILNQIADIGVSSSKREGLPVNIMEAMAVGLPIIATNVRGNRDLVDDGINGHLVEVDDYKKMAKKILEVYANKQIKSKFGENSLIKIEKYSKEVVNEEYYNIFNKL